MNKSDKKKLIKLIKDNKIRGFEINMKHEKVWNEFGVPMVAKLQSKTITLYLK